MKLSNTHILEYIKRKKIIIEPEVSEECVGSFSIDLKLSEYFRTLKPTGNMACIDPNKPNTKVMDLTHCHKGEEFYLHPGDLVLGSTVEKIAIPNDMIGWLDGRSSLARLGLMVHVTAHAIDPGWSGVIALEFVNVGHLPIILRPDMRICAISFEPLSGPTSKPYSSKKGALFKNQGH